MNFTKIIFDFKCRIFLFILLAALKPAPFLLFNEKYNAASDEELINAHKQSKSNQYIGILYNRYGHLVLGLCIKYLGNKDEASDAVVQIFTNLIADLRRHQVQFFKSWLFVYSKNYCLMELRKRQNTLKKDLEFRENAHLFMESDSPEHLKEREEQFLLMHKAISGLHKEHEVCIRLFYFRNKSYAEIVAITGYSANDVKSYIQNGKRNLKIKLEALINEQGRK
jgi:RNA polymerase sigma-70 factor (ECF subfamily)